ncbi:hypothetical protein E3J62_11785 [candidate division TA06 bacterium]|uniref:Uncharacterized protein n=1 Tax=candidate division TA06 bacterium TaxID=2250710 RepID=A0A523UNJ4_UNCT6|nr:MAG: hypothetical protein E3J62_11785 [candidate division TA06 bacterium]
MTQKEILSELEEIASRAGLRVKYDKLETKGGECLVEGKPYVIMNEVLPEEEKISILVSALKKVDLEGIFLKPKVREVIMRNTE